MRPTKDETWLNVALELSRQSTCLRRAVGCVLIDLYGEVDGTGWNGVARGQPHCNELKFVGADYVPIGDPKDKISKPTRMVESYPNACAGAKLPSGQGLDLCEALHAEHNALSQCTQKWDLRVAYVTHSPCVPCTKALLNTGVRRIVYLEEYTHPQAKDLWVDAGEGREWVQFIRR